MKIIILLSVFAIFICFSAESAQKTPKIKEKHKEIIENTQYRVKFGFWAASDTASIDWLKDALIESKKSELEKLRQEKRIYFIPGNDKLKVEKIHAHNLGNPFVEARLYHRGKNMGKVYVLTHFITSLCEPIE
jgi:hypothetical protein